MSEEDPFTSGLDHLLHIARERMARLDNATTHVDALTERYQILAAAMDSCVAARTEVEQRIRAAIRMNEPQPLDEAPPQGVRMGRNMSLQ